MLRREAPISHHPEPEDLLGLDREEKGFWAVVRYDDVRSISRDPDRFCSGEGVQFADAPQEMLEASQSFLAMDAPRHTKLRGLVQKAFSPRQVARIEEGIAANARLVVDEAGPTGGGDFVSLIAKRLPLITWSEMFGVAEADRDRVVEAADLLINASDPEFMARDEPLALLGQGLATLHEYATGLAAERASSPQDDLMTALVEAEIDGDRLTHHEIAAFFVLLAVAANDTTRHTTSHAMRALTEFPDQRTWLAGGPGRAPARGRRGVRALGDAGADLPPHDHRAGGAARRVDRGGGEGRALLPVGQPRRGRVRARPGRSTSPAIPTATPASAAAGRTTASAPRWPARSCGRSSPSCSRGCPTSRPGEPELLRSGFIHGVKRMDCSFSPA